MKPLETPFPIIRVEGDPYSCGVQHGEKARELVRRNVEYYVDLWGRNLGLSRERIAERGAELLKAIGEFSPDLLEELRGVAEGADVSLELLAAINGRYEVVWSEMRPQCTSLAVLPEASADGHTLLAQNWDYLLGVQDGCILLDVEEEGRPRILMHTEAGIIGQKGFNSEGLGLVVNALVSDGDHFEANPPFWIVCREMLRCSSISEAMKVFLNASRSVSYNVLLAQAGGFAVDLEATPLDVSILTPSEGLLAHTNHLIGPRALKVRDIFVKRYPDSVYRLYRAETALEAEWGEITTQTLMEILRDHYGKPHSICCHPDPREPEDFRGATLASIIIDLDERRMHITRGPPCQAEYREITLE